MINIALFASGNGSNVESIHNYIKNRKLDNPDRIDSMRISMVYTNNKDAYVINRCKILRIPYKIFDKDELNNGSILNDLKNNKIDFIALSGFLLLIPKDIIEYYNKKIINIHPSLLPKYGGKGMYGMNVHKEVIKNKESYSGVSFHYVNDKYDDGDIISKHRVRVSRGDTPTTLRNKIKDIEHKIYPIVLYGIIVKTFFNN